MDRECYDVEVCVPDSDEFTITEFDDFDEAVEYADQMVERGNEVTIYSGYDDFKKCAFCGEWYPKYELNEHGDCERCEVAIRDHGGY